MEKKIGFFLSFIFLLIGHLAYSQEPTNEMKQIQLAMQAGNAKILSAQFAPMLELKMEESEASYSNNQALFILKDFFKKHPPKSFIYNHKGHSPRGAFYAIGTYESLRGNFRVYIKLKNTDDSFFIDTLEFTKEK